MQPRGDFKRSTPDALRRETTGMPMNIIYHHTSHIYSLMAACTRIPFVAMVQRPYIPVSSISLDVCIEDIFHRAYFSAFLRTKRK